jgi:2-amino-4-hydroxy-6-hydroxymethyldihydropteridine diphosphokinase
MPFCLIGLGSNQGNRQHLLETAASRVIAQAQGRSVHLSSWHETTPIGGPADQPNYLNGALAFETSLPPEPLLALLQQIELDLGRKREVRWSQRTIDLDLLLYGDLVMDTPKLQLPHPRMAWRRFVLEPAAEVAGAMIHPTTGWTIERLLAHLNTTPWYIAITGPIAVGKTHLAQQLAGLLPARRIDEQPNWTHLANFYSDPASHAWSIELEFLEQRVQLLSSVLFSDVALPNRLTEPTHQADWMVSDFWFDQSAAFARAWLPPEAWRSFVELWQEKQRTIVRPKLVVLLDAPAKTLAERLRTRGRVCEQPLTEESLERIRQSILAEVKKPDVGPVLRLDNTTPEVAVAEVLAAARGME